MNILVQEITGDYAMTFADGESVYACIHEPLKAGRTLVLDFAGVEVFASPFFNAAIGRLLEDLPEDALRARLDFVNLNPNGSRMLKRVIDNAKEYYAATPEQRRSIDRVVMDNMAAV